MAYGRSEIMEMFAGVPECNREIIARKLSAKLTTAITTINKLEKNVNEITPTVGDVMKCFHLPFNRIRVVLIAQETYHTDIADGLCFSSKSVPHPNAVSISKCIANTCGQIMPANLQSWADQGMLMLNCALTTRVGKPGAHAAAWAVYTDAIIQEISSLPQKITFILLGNFAEKKRSILNSRHVILAGPLPNGKSKFTTNVFKELNNVIEGPPFVYGSSITFADESMFVEAEGENRTACPNTPSANTMYIFADGGAVKNGGPNCVSSWGICVTDGKIVGNGFATAHIDGGITRGVSETKGDMDSSNNRGELAAILHGLEYVAGLPTIPDRIVIVSDSMYAMNAVTTWSPNWVKDPKKLITCKNLDLIYVANAYLRALSTKSVVTQMHVKGHRREDRTAPDWMFWKGNDICDKKCTEALNTANGA